MPSPKTSKLAMPVLFPLLILFDNAYAASFDCAKASTQQEKAVCANPTLSALDDKLAESYRTARTVSQDAEKLKLEQIDWIKEVRKCQSDASCIERLYTSRLSELNQQPVKPTMDPVAVAPAPILPSVEQPAIAPLPVASATEATPVSEPVAPAATVESAVISANADSKSSIFSNEVHQRYALIAVGAIFGIIALFYLFKFFIAMAKRGSNKEKSAARDGYTKATEEAEKIKQRIATKAEDISAQAKLRVIDAADDFSKEGGLRDQIKAKLQKAAEMASSIGTDYLNRTVRDGDKVSTTRSRIIAPLIALNAKFQNRMDEMGYGRGLKFITYLGIPFILYGGFLMIFQEGSSNKTRDDSDPLKNEYIVRCWNYEKARQACATASDVSQCITIKTSSSDYMMAKIYCNGSTPNWSLMGK
jgi:uncharacterized protein